MKEFFLGCNYWAFHSGIDMWRDWNEEQVEKDFRLLKENHLTTLRVFPNWRDFQPVMPVYDWATNLGEYMMEGEKEPENPWYLDEVMLSRFEKMCELAGKYDLCLIVGIVTGWMSGRCYFPNVLNGKNLCTDPTALRFEELFVKGFVTRLRHRKEIIAWDLGNECNCMADLHSSDEAFVWTAFIANAIKATDPTRPIVSGMHSLSVKDSAWTIDDQAHCTDILTTHPYSLFVPHCKNDPLDSIRSLMHATCESRLYSAVGGKPCLVEELGTLGPNICNNKVAADFLRVNLLSNWAHNINGVLWWCMNEQSHLNFAPYSWNMLERELGMFDKNQKPKEFTLEMSKFAEWLEKTNIDIEEPKTDAVVLLSNKHDYWGNAYMSFILAKQAGVTVDFLAPNKKIPDSEVYFLPSVHYCEWMRKHHYDQLKQKVYDGATLFVTSKDGFFTEREEFLGTDVLETEWFKDEDKGTFEFEGVKIPYARERHQKLHLITAKSLATDERGDVLITENRYGKGKVIFVNFPVEESLLSGNRVFDGNTYKLYEYALKDVLTKKNVLKNNRMVGVTENGNIVTLINYSNKPQVTGLKLQNNKQIDKVLYGDPNNLAACDGAVFTIK